VIDAISFLMLFSIPVAVHSQDSKWAAEQDFRWGMSSLKNSLRHPLEKATYSDGKLELRVWYEDSSVTKGGAPGGTIFCRIAHSLIYGAYQLRSKEITVPIEAAFSSNKELKSVTMSYFAVVYRNRPNTPSIEANRLLSNPHGVLPLRVVWTREEQVVPYLSYSISRQEWASLSAVIRNARAQNFQVFRDSLCESVVKISPNLKANFQALTPQADETIDLVIENPGAE
jgi:hypothetical protein